MNYTNGMLQNDLKSHKGTTKVSAQGRRYSILFPPRKNDVAVYFSSITDPGESANLVIIGFKRTTHAQ